MEGAAPQRGSTQHRLEQSFASLDIQQHGGHPTNTETSYSYSYKAPTFQNAPRKFAPVTAPKPRFSGQQNGRQISDSPPPPPGPDSYKSIVSSSMNPSDTVSNGSSHLAYAHTQPAMQDDFLQHGSKATKGQPPPPPPPKPKNRPQQKTTAGVQSYQPVNYTQPAESDDLPPPPPPPPESESYAPQGGDSFLPPPPSHDDLPPPPPPNVSYTYTRTETNFAPQSTPAPEPAAPEPTPPPPPPPPAPAYEPRPSYTPAQPKYTPPATHSYTPPPQTQYRPPQPAMYSTQSQSPTRDNYQRYEETPPQPTQPTSSYAPTQQKYTNNYPPPANTYAQPTSSYESAAERLGVQSGPGVYSVAKPSDQPTSSYESAAERLGVQSGPGVYSVAKPSDQPLSRPDKTGTEAEVDALTNLLVQNMENSAEPDFFGMCGKCGQKVMGDENGCSAMDTIFHINCFTCVTCNGKLRGKPFYALEGKAYCEECYFATLEKCSVCHEPIMDRILRATGKPYHPRCFTCVECGKSLDGIPFTVDATNQIHCIEDFHRKFAPRCTVCQQPIMPEPGQEETVRIVAMDRSFHVSCYKCEDCGLLLSSDADGRGCYPLDDHILCRDCNARRIQTLTSRMSDQ